MKKRQNKRGLRLLLSMLFLVLIAAGLLIYWLWSRPTGESVKEAKRDSETEEQPKEELEEATESTEIQLSSQIPETEQGPQLVSVTISAAGDCTFGPTHTHGYSGSFHQYYDNNGEDYFFAGVKDVFQEDDFTLVNLECALTNEESHMDKEFCLKGKPEYAQILPRAFIEGVSMANNHTWDYFDQGLADTKNAVTAAGVSYAYYDETATYTTETGITIGWVSSSFLSYGEDRVAYMKNGIEALRAQGVDLVIACCHWGIERTYYPEEYQQTMAHNCIDWGADLVLGCHPHVIQGCEVYNGKVIVYSMGNFCFGGNSNPSDKNSMIYQQTFHFADGVLQPELDAKIIPCTVSSTLEYNDYQPTIAEAERRLEILKLMNEYSDPYGTASFDELGNLVQR